jgi:putative photosynthetic complex assembly protein 2
MRAVFLVVAFWWVATGVIIAMQANAATRLAGLIVATLLALVGVLEMRAVHDDESPSGVRRAFFGGAMLWAWVSATFYGGWLTGFHPSGPVPVAPSWGAVMPAIAATLVNDSATLLMLIGGTFMGHGAKNRTGLWTLLLFWGVQQVAKLNVFFGVANPAANFLPPHLAYLRQFFGPTVNSPFLAVSLVVVSAATVWAAWGARPSRPAGRREAAALYATILGLAVLELAVLGVKLESTPWDSFLRARGD